MTTSGGKGSPTKKAAPKKATGAAAPADDLDEMSDRLLAEVSLAGAPAMKEFHQLSRRDRADLTAQIAAIAPAMDAFQASLSAGGANDPNSLKIAADAARFYADAEDILRTLAVDPDSFTRWASGSRDEELLALFAQFVRSFSSGEANSSST